MPTAYAELAVTTNYSFLAGASHPRELVETAAKLGLAAIAIADRNSLAGVVRAHVAAKEHDIRLIIGARLVLVDGFEILCFPTERGAYGRLTRLLTLGNRRAAKGACHLDLNDLTILGAGQRLIAMPPYDLDTKFAQNLERLEAAFPGLVYLAASFIYRGNDRPRLAALAALAAQMRTPLVATNDVLYHTPSRRPLQDVLTCIHQHCTIDEAGFRLQSNAERHLKAPHEMHRLFAGYEDASARTLEIANACRFSLTELAYEYPDESSGQSATPQEELVRLAWLGAAKRFGQGINKKLRAMIDYELQLIADLAYAPYFLTVHDIVRFARTSTPPILCQGRGSAANSVVCYCLGITAVNPTEIDLLFERFISAERGEPPDIDVDFEHERREEVIQYIYQKYGRHRAGLAATVITYRTRSAVREVGKAMGLSPDVAATLAGMGWGHGSKIPTATRLRQAGLDPHDARLAQVLNLTRQIVGFPRHLSQHVGGFVITRGALDEVVPIANAAMKDRTVVEWDKDDLDALGILKIDVLALGMLTCLRKAFDLLAAHYGVAQSLASVPRDDPATFQMIQKADTIGVFQIESRAQMSMLPRLRPKNFYDLVIEIAIVRPGPIQGDMVHPYLRRRQGLEAVEYPSKALRDVLEKTLGVPLFQEQAMKIAIVGAGFTPAEADRLRRAMATFRHLGDIGKLRDKFVAGMIANHYTLDFAERCFKQIEGFSDYGFPESHSASFALLAYASAWLKCHYPDVFACALLNSQPMGFYSAASIVRDFRDHGGQVHPVDINHSAWDHTLQRTGASKFALRLGLRQVGGLRAAAAQQIVALRGRGFDSIRDLYFRTRLDMGVLQRLANADVFRSIGLDRRNALWAAQGLSSHLGKRAAVEDLPLFASAAASAGVTASVAATTNANSNTPLHHEDGIDLPPLLPGEHVVEDYKTMRLSLKAHPISFLRPHLDSRGVVCAALLADHPDARKVQVAGLVLVRQRPGTASGVIFMTLEDESGIANVIVWPRVFEKYRRVVIGARTLAVSGMLQKEQGVIHLIARHLGDLTSELMEAMETSPAASKRARAPTEPPSQWRHPRNVAVLPKGRNFH
ncbi:MAG: error-prone DNA polymerase [Alphaproteobacteria bacterium]